MLVTIATFRSQIEAEMAQAYLDTHNIRSYLQDANIIAADWMLSNAVGGIKLQVAEPDVAEATQLLQSQDNQRAANEAAYANRFVAFECDSCGQHLRFGASRRGGVESCNACGSYVDVPECPDEQLEHGIAEEEPNAVVNVSAEQAPSGSLTKKSQSTEAVSLIGGGARLPLKWELLGALCIFYFPVLARAVFDSSHTVSVGNEMGFYLLRLLEVGVPLLMLVALSGEPLSKFGIVPPRWFFDPILALICMFVFLTIVGILAQWLPLQSPIAVNVDGASAPSLQGWSLFLVCIVGFFANSLVEEFSMRGYLIPRLEELFGSAIPAVLVSSIMFASYHLHFGVLGFVNMFLNGLVYGLVFCITRSLWPLVLAHTLFNLLAFYSS